jgi:hypothetical protein
LTFREILSPEEILKKQVERVKKINGKIISFILNSFLVFVYLLVGIIFCKCYWYRIMPLRFSLLYLLIDHNVEKWSVIQSAYFIVTSISTVGYGDFVPTSDGSRVFTLIYVIFGISIIFSMIIEFAVGKFDGYEAFIRD